MDDVREITPEELEGVLPALVTLPGTGRAAVRRQVSGFLTYLRQTDLRWRGFRRGDAATPSGLLLALLLPGRTAIVMTPSPEVRGIEAASQTRVIEAGLEALRHEGLHYAQVLLEPDQEEKGTLLRDVGFRLLAPLSYLERNANFPWVDCPTEAEAEWVSYGGESHDMFAEVIRATYEGSLDCPELAGLRPMEDVLASHRAAGEWRAEWWQIARVRDEAAGCILLAGLPGGRAVEIVYTGVVPAARRRGVGSVLVRRALELTRNAKAGSLTVVVDERNEPARRLYQSFAFREVARRMALIYRWAAGGGSATGA